MSYDRYMRFELNIKDENITFYDFALEQIKGVNAKVYYYGTLSDPPHVCYRCGHGLDQGIIKHSFKSKGYILIPTSLKNSMVLIQRTPNFLHTLGIWTFLLI